MKVNCPKCNHEFDTATYEWAEILRTAHRIQEERFASMTTEELKDYIKKDFNSHK